jgi:hypothetical protein
LSAVSWHTVRQARAALDMLGRILAEGDPVAVRALLREHFDHADVFLDAAQPSKPTAFQRTAFDVREGSPLEVLCDDGATVLSVPNVSFLGTHERRVIVITEDDYRAASRRLPAKVE